MLSVRSGVLRRAGPALLQSLCRTARLFRELHSLTSLFETRSSMLFRAEACHIDCTRLADSISKLLASSFPSHCDCTRLRVLQPAGPSFIRCRQSAAAFSGLLRWEPFPVRVLFQGVPSGTCPPRQAACSQRFQHCAVKDFQMNFPPSQFQGLLASLKPLHTIIQVIPVLPSTALPRFIGGDFITTTGSSATRQRILPSLSLLLVGNFLCRTLPGFPG